MLKFFCLEIRKTFHYLEDSSNVGYPVALYKFTRFCPFRKPYTIIHGKGAGQISPLHNWPSANQPSINLGPGTRSLDKNVL